GEQTLSSRTDSMLPLLVTGRMPKICRGASHIVDISLEQRIFLKSFRLLNQGLMASCLHNPSLVEGQSAEITAAKASPVAGQTEPDLLKGRDASIFLIFRMPGSLIWETIDIVHLLLGERHGWGILNHIPPVLIRFRQYFPADGVRISILHSKAPGILCRFLLHTF